jgi:exopolysaccharide production protein ExoY
MSAIRILKRVFDFAVAAAGLLILFPVLTGIACWVILDSPGPVLFLQTRLGKGGKPFTLLKFRSMHVYSDGMLNSHLEANPEAHLTLIQFQKLMDDPRLTRAGRVLRRLSLDELPQLWNVLLGDMSLVGPRPCLPEQREFYGDSFSCYAAVRPGLTGLWQVSGRNRLSFAERAKLDVKYVREWSWGLDIKILLQTVGVVLTRDGAF